MHLIPIISKTKNEFLEKKRYFCALSFLRDYTMSYTFIFPMLWYLYYVCQELNCYLFRFRLSYDISIY